MSHRVGRKTGSFYARYTGYVKYLIGIDEAGRGALAGPVSVGAVLMPLDFDWREAFALVTKKGEPRLRDSKKLSPEQRDILYSYIVGHGHLKYGSGLVGADIIDAIGIVPATHQAAALALAALKVAPSEARVMLDAGLRVAPEWSQESFVRGDENVPVIALASIIAKVTRDRYMEKLPDSYAVYQFAQHKGYGTAVHRGAIQNEGMSDLHRKSFCANILVSR